MAILTPADRNLYFPTVSYPVGDDTKLVAACRRAQWLAESGKGANRKLELAQYTEQLRLNASFSGVSLSYAPISQVGAVTVQGRSGATRNEFGRTIQPTVPWIDLQPNQWTIDYQLNRLYIRVWGATVSWFSEIRVTYWSGWDFSQAPLDYEAEQIKMAVAALLEYQEIAASLRGDVILKQSEVDTTSPDALLQLGGDKIKQIEFTDDVTATFQDTKLQRSQSYKATEGKLTEDYENALSFLKRYQPRRFF